jgi:response regulator RpfG family c-di-GMP phosphodiesterase
LIERKYAGRRCVAKKFQMVAEMSNCPVDEVANIETDILEQADAASPRRWQRLWIYVSMKPATIQTGSLPTLCWRVVLPRRIVATNLLGPLLHDIGKIGISDAILLKQGTNEDERMQCEPIPERIPHRFAPAKEAAEIVLSHEERFGSVIRGLRGEISLGARLFAVIDTGHYLTALIVRQIHLNRRDEIIGMGGTQFDPAAVHFGRRSNVARRWCGACCQRPHPATK